MPQYVQMFGDDRRLFSPRLISSAGAEAKGLSMTVDDFMKMVTRYTEACDDLGTGLFEQTAQETGSKIAKAEDLWKQIRAEVDRLHAEYAKSERRALAFGDHLHHYILVMRAAVVDGHLQSHAHGLQWIYNTLEGPGQLPDMDEAEVLGGAQAMFDKEVAEQEAFRTAHPAP